MDPYHARARLSYRSAITVNQLRGRVSLREIQCDHDSCVEPWLTERWTPAFRATKRVFDIILALMIMIVIAPLILIVCVLIKLDSSGPIIYSQERIGKSGKRFRLYKLRTMYPNADREGAYAMKDDPRITRVGRYLRKTRLDEIPQLWNVLTGDMSLIGPRPELPQNESMLEAGIPGFSFRTVVKPGLTGWAQICAPYANTIETSATKLEYDLYYIRNASIWLDIRIAWRTFLVMVRLAGQ